MSIAQTVKQHLASHIQEKFGIEVVEVEYAKKQNGMNLTVFIDQPAGITLEDCEKVHREIDPMLDELNPTGDNPYTLNVSSCGLDWKLVSDRDFERVLEQEIEVSLFSKHNGKKEFVGVLKSFNENNITLEEDGMQFELPRKAISKATRFLDF